MRKTNCNIQKRKTMNETNSESKKETSKLTLKPAVERRGGFYCISFRKVNSTREKNKKITKKSEKKFCFVDNVDDGECIESPVFTYETKNLRPRRKPRKSRRSRDDSKRPSYEIQHKKKSSTKSTIRFLTKEESRQQIIEINNHNFDLIRDFGLKRDKQNKSVCCPCCGNGNGDDGDGLSFLRRNARFQVDRFKCFRCLKSFSRIDLYMYSKDRDPHNKTHFHESIEELKKIANRTFTGATIQPAPVVTTFDDDKEFIQNEDQIARAKNYLKNISPFETTPVDARRGVSIETANRFNVFFHSRSQRIVFKFSPSQYKARSIRKNEKLRYINNGGAQRYFGDKSIINGGAKILFFVEGTFDAISGFETGVEGVDFVSYEGAQIETFCKYLKRHNFHNSGRDVIFFNDDDDGGNRFRETFKEFAIRYNINTHFLKLPLRYMIDETTGEEKRVKDFNDYLIFNRDEFTQFIRRAKEIVESQHVATFNTQSILEELPVIDVATTTPQLETIAIEEESPVFENVEIY